MARRVTSGSTPARSLPKRRSCSRERCLEFVQSRVGPQRDVVVGVGAVGVAQARGDGLQGRVQDRVCASADPRPPAGLACLVQHDGAFRVHPITQSCPERIEPFGRPS